MATKVKITVSKGPEGAVGPKGFQGSQGSSAYEVWLTEGNSGTVQDYLDSLVGAQGIQGVTGPAASPPPAPDAPTVVVGSTTTGAAGTSATVTDTDSGANVSLNFVVPAGATGATGGTGPTGATGAAGTDGVGIPSGGTTGQSLVKINDTAYNTEWSTINSGPSFSSDITLWCPSGKSFGFDGYGSSETNPSGIAFKPDGSKMFIVGKNDNQIKEFALSTAFDVTTATFTSEDSISSSNPIGLSFSPDGTKFFSIDDSGDIVKRYDLSTAWDTSTLSLNSNQGDITSDGVTNPRGVVFKTDGTKMFAVDRSTKDVSEFTLSTAWDLSTLSFVDATDIPTLTSVDRNLSSLFIDSDGSKVFITDEDERIFELSLSTAWDFSTASYVGVKSGFEPENTFTAINYVGSINKAFIIGDANNKVYEYVTGGVDHRSDNNTVFSALTTSAGIFAGSTIESVGNITSGGKLIGTEINTNSFISNGSGRINHTGNSLHLSDNSSGYSSMNMGAYPFKSLESKKIWLATSSKGTTSPSASLNTVGNDVGYGSSSSVHVGTPGPNSYLDVNGVTHLRAASNVYGKLTVKGLKDLVAHNGITASGSTVFNETFTESSDTSITSHTSDSGHTYSVLYDDTGGSPTLNVSGGNGYAQISSNTNNEGLIVKSSSTTSGDYEIIWNVDWASVLNNNYHANFVVGAVDADNYFWFNIASNLSGSSDLNKKVSGSSSIVLDDIAGALGDNSISASTADVEVKFRNISGKSYIYVNDIPVLLGYTIDGFPYGTAHSSGFGVGAHPLRTNDESWDWKFNSIVQKSILASDLILDEALFVESGARINNGLAVGGFISNAEDEGLANANITIAPRGTGLLEVRGGTNSAAIKLNCEANTHGVIIQSPPHSAGATYTLTLPNTDGSANQVLKTDGSGNLDWVAQTTDTNTQNTTTLSFVDSSDDIILRNTTGGAGSGTDDIKFVAGSNITLTHTDTDNITIAASGSGGSSTFVGLSDTPGSFTASKFLKVNSAGNAIEFVDNPSGGLSNVVEDTTPQLGGDLDTNGKNVLFAKTGNTDHSSNGDIVKIGTGSTTQGELCYYTSSGTWVAADADATGTAGGVLLAIALGTDPDVDGMLLRGMYTLNHDPGTIADELYVSTTAGDITGTAPSGTGDVVRVVGYCLDSANGQVWFNPSNDFIVLA